MCVSVCGCVCVCVRNQKLCFGKDLELERVDGIM